MKFELMDVLNEEQRSRKDEVNRKKSVFETEQTKLTDLQTKLNGMILKGASEADLDKVYDEIAKQETITDRRRNEYHLVSERPDTSKFTDSEVTAAFRQFREKYEQAKILPLLDKLDQMKQDYIEEVKVLEQEVQAFNNEAAQLERNWRGCASDIEIISYKREFGIKIVPTNHRVW